jgi:hypothetical protein
VPIDRLRNEAHQLLALARKAQEEGRPADAFQLMAKALEHLEDAMSVAEARRSFEQSDLRRDETLDRRRRSTAD